MDLIRYLVKAVVLEGLSVREVAAAHGVSRSWVYECLARYRADGDQGLRPRSRRPSSAVPPASTDCPPRCSPATAPCSPPRHGACVIEGELLAAGITYRHSRPYHPQTCGKAERFHQTLKKWLTCQRPVTTVRALQAQPDRFATYYNTRRPHRAIGRQTPATAYTARIKATPAGPVINIPAHCRVRQDTIDTSGTVTLRHRSKLYHIGVGRQHAGTRSPS